MTFLPLCRHAFADVRELDAASKWWDSHHENVRCRDFMDEQVRQNFDGIHLESQAIADSTVAEFGFDRTMWVLARHVQHYDYDGRFSNQNKVWAQSIQFSPVHDADRDADFLLNSHPTLVDALTKQVREKYAALNLYDHHHRIEGDIHQQDFKGKLLILRDDVLNEASRTPENQLFLASSGFGCSPDASGRAVFGAFLIDGEQARFARQDFIGICDERYLADWAKETLAVLQSQELQGGEESEGMTMKGAQA
ncbi:MAG: DUF3849 domain-containing protein [Oscillospiraceae bacterium]|jgi:hypothetical protein|nr:DUF3849 domain-containing protein [Oscillospiraceae bacterium]